MATYAVGDLQGCLSPLQHLLKQVQFNDDRDQLWLVGDLINRGPESLATLEFLYPRRDNIITVLGNHDLHLLACAFGYRTPGKSDTLDEILNHPSSAQYYQWLRCCPLLHHDPSLDAVMVHAGIPPCWDLPQAQQLAREVEQVLQGRQFGTYLENMYGNTPDTWDNALEGPERWRLITNYFTRMRFCNSDSRLELKTKTGKESPPGGFQPWFAHPHRKTREQRIVFGHWAALEGQTDTDRVFALDTGCVWGGPLTLMHLEEQQRFSYQP